jgi:hypothetical protein
MNDEICRWKAYPQFCTTLRREADVKAKTSRQISSNLCTYCMYCIWVVFLRMTCRLGFCPFYTLSGTAAPALALLLGQVSARLSPCSSGWRNSWQASAWTLTASKLCRMKCSWCHSQGWARLSYIHFFKLFAMKRIEENQSLIRWIFALIREYSYKNIRFNSV